MALLSVPTYQDYLQNYGRGGDGALSQDQWNAFNDSQKWQNVGSGLAIAKSDPRYADLAKQMGVTDGGLLNLAYAPQSIAVNGQNYVDPSRVVTDGNVYGTAHSNETPKTQFAGGGLSDKEWALLATSLIGGGALGAFDGLGAAGGTGTGAGVEGGFTGYGDIAASGGSGSAGAAGGGLLAGDESAGLNMANPFEAGSAGDESAGLSMANPFQASGGVPVTDLGVPAQVGAPVVDHGVAAAGNGMFSGDGLLSQAGNWAVSHPLQAAGLAQTAYGLLGGHGSAGGSSSSTSGSKGGSGTTTPVKGVQQQFYVNPYLQAQINRGYGQ